MASDALHPPLKWAQRKDIVYVTISVEDIKDEELNINEKSMKFQCVGGSQERHKYSFDIELFGEVLPEMSKKRKTDRELMVILSKKEKRAPFWPRLAKTKLHFIHVDFGKWKDEDDSSDDDMYKDEDFESMMNNLNPKADTEGDADNEDSDDEKMPDLEPAK